MATTHTGFMQQCATFCSTGKPKDYLQKKSTFPTQPTQSCLRLKINKCLREKLAPPTLHCKTHMISRCSISCSSFLSKFNDLKKKKMLIHHSKGERDKNLMEFGGTVANKPRQWEILFGVYPHFTGTSG